MQKTIVIIGSATCSYCKKFKPLWTGAAFAKWAADAGIAVVDAVKDSAAYKKWRTKVSLGSINFPTVAIFDGSTKVAMFLARSPIPKPFTEDGLIKHIEALCPDCCDGCGDAPVKKNCPTCKGAGFVLASLALLLAMGCTATRFENLDGGGFKMTRLSLLQKVEMPNVTVLADGSVSLDGYSNDGGNEATAKLVEAALKLGAAGAAVAP